MVQPPSRGDEICRTPTVRNGVAGESSQVDFLAEAAIIGRPDPTGGGLSHLLARIARSLSLHWKRSRATAVGVLVLLVLAAGAGGDATDDTSLPGAESQQAIDLFQAHSPAFGGVDSTLVFTVAKGKVSDPAPRAAIESALAKVRKLDGVELATGPFEPGGQVSENSAWRLSTCATPATPRRSRRKTARR